MMPVTVCLREVLAFENRIHVIVLRHVRIDIVTQKELDEGIDCRAEPPPLTFAAYSTWWNEA
jgi:hypothetical protein